MKTVQIFLLTTGLASVAGQTTLTAAAAKAPHSAASVLPRAGETVTYKYAEPGSPADSVVRQFTLTAGAANAAGQWWRLAAGKANGGRFTVWWLGDGYPPERRDAAQAAARRYLLQEGDRAPVEFQHARAKRAVLPCLGGWRQLFPRVNDAAADLAPGEVVYLGHRYRVVRREKAASPAPPAARVIRLTPDLLIGVPHNSRQRDETRRYDDSDYELVRLTRADYEEMMAAGMTCFRVDAEQAGWLRDRDVYYWGVGGKDAAYPECLYRSNYLGPVLFLNEPAVCTRDFVLRPRLAKDPRFRRDITPQIAAAEFARYFDRVLREGTPWQFCQGLAVRPDVDLGVMRFPQANLYSWETMPATAAYQLLADPRTPAAFVFEPPDRLGTRRTLPEIDLTYGCQIPPDDPRCFTSLIYGFLRGAARQADKQWGMSIYGSVDRADAGWFLTHAYDWGARFFFFWDSHRLACVPYAECLALTRHLRNHVQNFPERDAQTLRRAAEVAILLPPGYNLGHVHLGKGSLWGLGELNLERRNRWGVKYRTVMRNFFVEIERCLRLGVGFDLLWDLPELRLEGYREVVRVREDGRVAVRNARGERLFTGARVPERPDGDPPHLAVRVSRQTGRVPLEVTATARVTPGAAPVFYTLGADVAGVYHNAVVAWELYGPEAPDYRCLMPPQRRPQVRRMKDGWEAQTRFRLTRPGTYRLRAATVDHAGRATVVWTTLNALP